jgi:hypothetical protein
VVVNLQTDRYVTETVAAELLGFKPQTLRKWRQRHTGPPYRKCGPKAVRYFVPDIIAWADRSRMGEDFRTANSLESSEVLA